MQAKDWRTSVKNILQIALLISLFLSSCTVLLPPGPPQKYGANDYAVGEAEPYPQEVKLGRRRLENFIRRANPRQKQLLAENLYVAVQANELVAGEDWPLLRELASGRARAGQYYMQDFRNLSNFPVKFLLIYDARTERLVNRIGALVVDTPNLGQVASFTGVRAVYAGTGWWPIL
jgi:hypothetical protein